MNYEKYDTSPIILDPLTNFNASKSSYNIEIVQESFSQFLKFLELKKCNFELETTNAGESVNKSSNIILEFLTEL